MALLGKSYTMERKISLISVTLGVYLVCSGDNSSTFWGFIVTFAACILGALKVVLSNKFLSGDLNYIDMRKELDHMAAFFHMVVAYKKKIGATFQLLIEPKPREPMKHQYDYDAATCMAFFTLLWSSRSF